MVNQTVVEYLKNNSDKFPIERLKQKIISAGYPEPEVNNAIALLNLVKKQQSSQLKSQSTQQPILPQLQQPPNSYFPQQQAIQQEPYSGFKWMKLAGILGIILLVIFVSSFIYSLLQNPMALMQYQQKSTPITISYISLILLILVSVFFTFGFVKMGKHTQTKVLTLTSWIFIILEILLLALIIFSFIMYFTTEPASITMDSSQPTPAGEQNYFPHIISSLIVLFFLTIFLLFSLGLIKAGEQVRFAKPSGIIILILTLILILGFLSLIIIALFFKELLTEMLLKLVASLFSAALGTPDFLFTLITKIIPITLSILNIIITLLLTLSLFDASRKFEQTTPFS